MNGIDQGIFILGIKVFNGNIWELIVRYSFNFIIAFLIIKLIYYRNRRNNDYFFTYFMFNTIIFFVCYLLSSVTLSIGFAFGLFAVFAILRYRTKPIPIKEMTYLFIVITIGVINALGTPDISLLELFFTNITVVLLTFILEAYLRQYALAESIVIYKKIEDTKPENRARLLADLQERTGLNIKKLDVLRRNFRRDFARIKIFYSENDK